MLQNWISTEEELEQLKMDPANVNKFEDLFKPEIKELFTQIQYFLIGYLFEPFESNKKTVRRLLGLIINHSDTLRTGLWNLIEEMYNSQIHNNLFDSSFIGQKGNHYIYLICFY